MRLTLFQQPSNTGEEIMDIVLVGVIGTLLISGIAGGLAVLVVALLMRAFTAGPRPLVSRWCLARLALCHKGA